jgi:dolichol-phosphate mannosyltransferase
VKAPLLSVIIPVYNEERTIDALLARVVHGPYPFPEKEVIVVDDGSRDRTGAILDAWRRCDGVSILRHPVNRGKGAAVRTGVALARGAITIIQDADLEYDPDDYPLLVERIRGGEDLVVYGSRYLNPSGSLPWSKYRVAVWLLNHLVRCLYGQRLTDEATCYKAFRTDLTRRLALEADRFELCAEMTAKFCRLGIHISEVPVSYRPRTVAEGKKIGWRDAWHTLTALLRWRFARLTPLRRSDCDSESTVRLRRHHAEDYSSPRSRFAGGCRPSPQGPVGTSAVVPASPTTEDSAGAWV